MEMRTDRTSSRIVTAIGCEASSPMSGTSKLGAGAGTAVQNNASFLALTFVYMYSLCDLKYRSFVRVLLWTGPC